MVECKVAEDEKELMKKNKQKKMEAETLKKEELDERKELLHREKGGEETRG